jgi:LiaF transmembrane domain/B-box zinc finger
MNCANHPNVLAEAYCRTCGKPLCATCTRDVKGVIYCENCLAARLEGVPSPPQAASVTAAPLVPAAPVYTPAPQGGPNPALAGILAGFFPFGVGAVYTGQYAKGLAHLIIFTLLIVGASSGSDVAGTLFGLGIAFFYIYQIVDAVRSAKALQMGQPAPDPFGLAQAFGAGDKIDTSKVPAGAVVLIVIGLMFLLRNTGLFNFSFHLVWPVFLMLLGGWLFARAWGLAGPPATPFCYCDRCRMRRISFPVMLFTVGLLWLLDDVSRLEFGRTWPVLFLVFGIMLLLRNSASTSGHQEQVVVAGPTPGQMPPPPPGSTAETQQPTNEVKNV